DPTGRFEAAAFTPGPRPVLRVRTKSDQTPARRPGDPGLIAVCALDGTNLPTLRRAIADAAGAAAPAGAVALPRHRRAIAAAVAHLDQALALTDPAAHA